MIKWGVSGRKASGRIDGYFAGGVQKNQVVPTVDKGSIGGYPPKDIPPARTQSKHEKSQGEKLWDFWAYFFHKALVIDWNPVSKQ